MLETILKEINTNLERIANAMDTKITVGMAVKDLAGIKSMDTSEQQSSTSMVEEQDSSALTVQIPTTQQSFTQEQLAVAMSNTVAAGKMSVVQGILQQFNVQALTQINPQDYNKVATLLKEAGVMV